MKYIPRGQVMLLTVLVLGGVILGAAAIAGLLMIYQLRQASDLSSSAKAIFAADAGIECGLYRNFKDVNYDCAELGRIMTNGASFTAVLSTTSIKSVGSSGRSSRAFELTFTSP